MNKDSKNTKAKVGAGIGAAAATATAAAMVMSSHDEAIAEVQDGANDVILEEEVITEEELLVADVITEEPRDLEMQLDEVVVEGHAPIHDDAIASVLPESPEHEVVIEAAETLITPEPVLAAVTPEPAVAAPIAPEKPATDFNFDSDDIDPDDNTGGLSDDDTQLRRGDGSEEDSSFLSDIAEDIMQDIHNLL